MAGAASPLTPSGRPVQVTSGTVPVLGLGAMLAGWLLVHVIQAATSGASLHVDEAQYWDWSRELHWGFHSKPPLVAAVIAATTRLLGDVEWVVRVGVMACWPLAAAACGALAVALTGRASAAFWGVGVLLASPWAGLLGLVATTDGPLMLAWALALLALHRALHDGGPLDWTLLAVALALGVLAKYTALALWAGAWLAVLWRRRGSDALALGAASLLALLLLLPHLAWLARSDWVTLRHTAEITATAGMASATPPRAPEQILLALGLLAVGIGPLALLALAAWRPARHLAPRRRGSPWGAKLLTAVPLAAAGAVQAGSGALQPNWLAPLLLPASLGLAAAAVAGSPRFRRLLLAALVVQWLVVLAATSGPALAQRAGLLLPSTLDPWSRMRGWGPALSELARELPGDAVVLTESRSVIAQAAWHWRDGRGAPRLAFAPRPQPRHHYEGRCPWRAGDPKPTHVLLDAEPSAELRAALGRIDIVAHVEHPLTRSRTLRLALWRVAGAADATEQAVCR